MGAIFYGGKNMIELKNANFRHGADGKRIADVVLYTKSLDNLPTDASDIEGLLADDVLDIGSIALDMTTGHAAMFDGTDWNKWS